MGKYYRIESNTFKKTGNIPEFILRMYPILKPYKKIEEGYLIKLIFSSDKYGKILFQSIIENEQYIRDFIDVKAYPFFKKEKQDKPKDGWDNAKNRMIILSCNEAEAQEKKTILIQMVEKMKYELGYDSEYKPSVKPPARKISSTSEQYERDTHEEKYTKERAGYMCEVNEAHKTFVMDDGNRYMEAHHLIPLHHQDKFAEVSIDVSENMICVCPNCHKMLHHQKISERTRILSDIFDKRKLGKLLASRGIKVTLNEFLELSTS